MAMTALHAGMRLTNVTVYRDELTGDFSIRYDAEVADGFEARPITANAQGLTQADAVLEATHNAIIGDLNDQAEEILNPAP